MPRLCCLSQPGAQRTSRIPGRPHAAESVGTISTTVPKGSAATPSCAESRGNQKGGGAEGAHTSPDQPQSALLRTPTLEAACRLIGGCPVGGPKSAVDKHFVSIGDQDIAAPPRPPARRLGGCRRRRRRKHRAPPPCRGAVGDGRLTTKRTLRALAATSTSMAQPASAAAAAATLVVREAHQPGACGGWRREIPP